ncbi:hypothetical protein JCM10207_001794 [Rhodosporidiobolus poonsookiae]
MTVEGKCNCGAVTVTIPSMPDSSVLCHCKNCRASSAGIFSVNLVVHTKDLTIHNEANTTLYRDTDTDTGNTAVRRFCKTCGSPIVTRVEEDPDTNYVKGGLFPVGSLPAPGMELFTRNWEQWEKKYGETKCL